MRLEWLAFRKDPGTIAAYLDGQVIVLAKTVLPQTSLQVVPPRALWAGEHTFFLTLSR